MKQLTYNQKVEVMKGTFLMWIFISLIVGSANLLRYTEGQIGAFIFGMLTCSVSLIFAINVIGGK